jgi:ribosomal protein S18 acetylase RimI-like enzyme
MPITAALCAKGNVLIREAIESDCKNIATLSLQIWLDTYAIDGVKTDYSEYVLSTFTEEYFLNLLNESNRRILISSDGEYIQGYVLINLESHFNGEENGFEIERLYVHKKYAGQGIGRKLLFEVQGKHGNKFWLYTWIENESNGFYKHLGFKHIGQYEFKFANELIENNVFAFKST